MTTRFQLITVFEDCTCKTEAVSDIPSALRAMAIYYEEPDFISSSLYDFEKQCDIARVIKT